VADGVLEEERLGGFVGLRDWVHPRWRLGARAGLERWSERGRYVNAGARVRWLFDGDAGWAEMEATGWTGAGRPFGRTGISAGWKVEQSRRHEWRVQAGAVGTTRHAPRSIRAGAGTGLVRDPLLRGHPLVEEGAIDGEVFGSHLVHTTVEHRVFERFGPAVAGAALFVDAAAAWRSSRSAVARAVDPGLALFVNDGAREAMVSLSWGSGTWHTSARVGRSW
jgi:hypothetical protein